MSCAAQGVEDIHDVLSAMQKNLECPICLDLMKEPVTTRCDHIFCRFCMLQLLSKKKKGRAQCPLCKKEVTKRSLQESPRFKLLIDGLMKIINAFELDSGNKFFPSQDYAKSILVTRKEEEKEEEQMLVQSTGYRNRNRKRTINRGQCEDFSTLLEIDADPLLAKDVGTQSFNRPKRKKPETNNIKSKKQLITEFESPSSEDDLFKKVESLGSNSDGSPLLSDRAEGDDAEKCQDNDSKIHDSNDCISLRPEIEDAVASDLAEYGFSERDLESTKSNLFCMDGVRALTETTTQKRTLDARDSLILDGDFAEREDEQSPHSNLISNVMHSEHNNQAASTMQLVKLFPDESQALKIAIDYPHDKDDSQPEDMTSTQSSPGDVLCRVPKKRMKRSIRRVKEWLLKTSSFINAMSWDEELVSENVPEDYAEGSDKGSSMSDETEFMPSPLPSILPNIVEKPAVTVEDKVFGKVYRREKKSKTAVKITCVADVHVDAGVHSPKLNAPPNVSSLKRKRKTASGLQPEDFIKKTEVIQENGNDRSKLVVTYKLLDSDTNEADTISKCLNLGEINEKENGLSVSDAQKTKNQKRSLRKKSDKSQGTRNPQSLLLVRGSDCRLDKQLSPHHSYETKIDCYPSNNEPGQEDKQRKVRRSKRLNMLLPEITLPTSPSLMETDSKVKVIERDLDKNDTLLKTTIFTKPTQAAVDLESNETSNVKQAKVQALKSMYVTAQLTESNLKASSNAQSDVRNVLSAEEIEDSDLDTQHLLKTFKSAKRMSFKLDPVETSIKENCNPMHLNDVNTKLPNGHEARIELAVSDKGNCNGVNLAVLSAAPTLNNSIIGEGIQAPVQNLPVRLPESLTKQHLRDKKKHGFYSDNCVEGSGESTEKPMLYENESLPGGGQLTDLSQVNETEPHEEGNQGRNAAVSRSEELVLLSESESLRLHPTVTHQSPYAVRRGDTRSGTGQGENEQAKDYCYQKHSFDEEQVNQITSVNGPKFSVMKKLHSVSHEGSPVKSPEVLSDTPDGLLGIADNSRADGSFCAEKSFVFGNEKKPETFDKSVSPLDASQFVRHKKRAQKLVSSEEELSEDEELPCFNHLLFGNASCSAGQNNPSANSSPKQQGGGVLVSSNSTSGKTPTSLNLPKGAFSSSQESVNLFSSQSNTPDHFANGNANQDPLSKPFGSPEKSSTRETDIIYNYEDQIDGEDNEKTKENYEGSHGEQNLDEVSGCDSEASHTGDSSGLSSQCEILNTQQRDAMQNNLEKLQREMAVLEAVLKQHGTRSPSSAREQASTSEHATIRLQEARQEQTDHGTCISPDAIPDSIQSLKCAEPSDKSTCLKSSWQTPPPSPPPKMSLKDTPEKVRASLKLLEDLKECVLTQKEASSMDESAECSQSTKRPDATEPPPSILNQTTASPRRSRRVPSQINGVMNSVSIGKGRSSLPMESTKDEQQSRETKNGSIGRSLSPTFTSPARSRKGFLSGKIPIIPNRRNFSLVASGLSLSELMLVQKFARKTQSLLSSQMSESTTHVIIKTDEDLVCERTLKYFLGIAGRKWVVSYDWIVQSFREGRILDEYDFEVRGDVINGRNHRGPRRSRLGSDGLLLSDFEICCLGTFKDLTRENLEWMVSLCGASVVKDPQLFKNNGDASLVVLQPDGNTDYAAIRKKYCALIISREWVLDSVASYKLQTFDSYLL